MLANTVLLTFQLFAWILGWNLIRYFKSVKTDSKSFIDWNEISLIVPARNEEENLAILLQSLQISKIEFGEVIVVNDQSTDSTAMVAKEYGAKVINLPSLPEGWRGKNFACSTGSTFAQKPWIFFVDADCSFVGKTKILNDGSVASFLPYHRIDSYYEELSSIFNTVMAMGVMSDRPKLFGQSLLIHKDQYAMTGGHETVKNQILENVALARIIHSKGLSTNAYLGKNFVEMRMFPHGASQMHESWIKGFSSGAAKIDGFTFAKIMVWIFGISCCAYQTSFHLLIQGFDNLTPYFLVMYALFGFQIFYSLKKIGNYSAWQSILYPIPLTYFHSIFFIGAIKKMFKIKNTWKGRDVSELT